MFFCYKYCTSSLSGATFRSEKKRTFQFMLPTVLKPYKDVHFTRTQAYLFLLNEL